MIELSDLRLTINTNTLVTLSNVQECQLARKIEKLLLNNNILCDVRVKDTSYFIKKVGVT